MHITLPTVANNSLGEVSGLIRLDIDAHEVNRDSIDGLSTNGRDLDRSWATLPPRPHAKSASIGGHRKNDSLSTVRNQAAFVFGSDDLEGDLGYAAAEGMEGNQRKVIVERLEAVKSKNPVFTWC